MADKAPFFRSPFSQTVNWTKFIFNLTGVSMAWGMMAEFIPSVYFRKTAAALALAVFLFSYFTRSGKWAENRQEQVPSSGTSGTSGPLQGDVL